MRQSGQESRVEIINARLSNKPLGNLVAYSWVVKAGFTIIEFPPQELHCVRQRSTAAGGLGHRKPLLHQSRNGHRPTAIDCTEAGGIGNSNIGKENFAELTATGRLLDWPHFNAGSLHINKEVRHTLMLGHRGVSTRNNYPVIGDMGPGCPDLLTIEHPILTVTNRAETNAPKVRTGGRLGKQLTPDFLTPQRGQQITLLLLF